MKTKIAILFALVLLSNLPAHAQFKTIGRAIKNMATFRDRKAAILQWATVGAALLDGYTTQRGLANNPNLRESNPLYGSHPSPFRIHATNGGLALFTVTSIQHFSEQNSKLRYVPAFTSIGIHTYGAVNNIRLGALK